MMAIEWRDVPGYEGIYQVSSDGQVYSMARVSQRSNSDTGAHLMGRPRKARQHRCGYMIVTLHRDNERKTWYVHMLVMLAFVGPHPQWGFIHHKNGNYADNRLENLEYRQPRFNAAEVAEMRQRYANGESMASIARAFDGTPTLIEAIVKNEIYLSQTRNF